MTEQCEQRLKSIGDDQQLRKELDAVVAGWQSGLTKTLDDAIDKYADEMHLLVDERVDPEFSREVLDVERKALKTVFQAEIADPLQVLFKSSLREVGAIE